jgi:integrase/recombinase XerD
LEYVQMAEAWNLDQSQILSVEEANRLLELVAAPENWETESDYALEKIDELIIVTLILSGLRNSEFCGLCLGDALCRERPNRINVRPARGAKRTVFVPARVAEVVVRYIDEVRPDLLPEGVDADDEAQPLVFSERKRPFDRTGLYRRVVRILTEAGFGERASVQLLRHTYGYLAYLRTGGNLLFVQRQLGHAHPRITSVYARLVEESYADLAERVARPAAEEGTRAGQAIYEQCRPAFDCETD